MTCLFNKTSSILNPGYLILTLLLVTLQGCNAGDNQQEISIEAKKTAILETIATETEAYFNEDYELWKNQFVDEDYFMRIGYWEGYPNKVSYHEGFDTLRTEKKLQFEQGATQWSGSEQTRENLKFQIYDEVAWVTYDQLSLDPETGEHLGTSKEIKILEKVDGQWRLAYIGFYYLPE
jgi:hypothetical protein